MEQRIEIQIKTEKGYISESYPSLEAFVAEHQDDINEILAKQIELNRQMQALTDEVNACIDRSRAIGIELNAQRKCLDKLLSERREIEIREQQATRKLLQLRKENPWLL